MNRTIVMLCIACLSLFILSVSSTSITAQTDDIIPTPEATSEPALIEPAVAVAPQPNIQDLEQFGPLILRERTSIREGPGLTFTEMSTMGWWNRDIFVVERNRLGNWVRTMSLSWGEPTDGWVRTGHLLFEDSDVRLSQVPENNMVLDFEPENLWSEAVQYMYTAPTIPTISPRMREVFELGQSLGNNANVVTKIGDSLSASPIYLNLIVRGDHDLGPYDFLEPTLDFFRVGIGTG